MTVRGIRGAAKASAVFVGQCRFGLLKLLESRASKDGWCTLMDRQGAPIPANGEDGSEGYARLWVTISCNLRGDDRGHLSEMGFSRERTALTTQQASTKGSSGASPVASRPGSAAAFSALQSIGGSIDSEQSSDHRSGDETASTEGEFADGDGIMRVCM